MGRFRVDYFGAGEYSGLDIIGTNVRLVNDSDSVIFVRLKGNYTNRNKNEILDLALEQFYEDTFPNRAENEKFRKFEGLISEGEKSIKRIKDDFEKIKAENSTMQMALVSLLNKLASNGDITGGVQTGTGVVGGTGVQSGAGQVDTGGVQSGAGQVDKPNDGTTNADNGKPNENSTNPDNGKGNADHQNNADGEINTSTQNPADGKSNASAQNATEVKGNTSLEG